MELELPVSDFKNGYTDKEGFMLLHLEAFKKGLESSLKIFEGSRYLSCSHSSRLLAGGSGTMGQISDCQLRLEILELAKTELMYNRLTEESKGIEYDSKINVKDYEPTNKQLDQLTKTNKTYRGCIKKYEKLCDIYGM